MFSFQFSSEIKVPVTDRWDPSLYENHHGFVHQMGAGVLELLAPKPGERVLDLGCGTGTLTQQIVAAGANVLGVDASPAMIAEARNRFPNLQFKVQDATSMHFEQPFDAVFSNAVMHWIRPPEVAAEKIYQALKPHGRFVCEFGGHGCVQRVLDSAVQAGREMGIDLEASAHVNYFPSVSEYAMLLEQQGFEVTLAHLFDRPTPLDGDDGLRNWIRMFRTGIIESVPETALENFFTIMERIARPVLFQNGIWSADYRRLRIVAHHA
jgi:trans-aconitate methyltransferase